MKKKYTNLEVGDLLIEREWTKAHNDGVPFFLLAMIVGVRGVVEGGRRPKVYSEYHIDEWHRHALKLKKEFGL